MIILQFLCGCMLHITKSYHLQQQKISKMNSPWKTEMIYFSFSANKTICQELIMHQAISAVTTPPSPPPPFLGNTGAFSHTVHQGVRLILTFHPITPGKLTNLAHFSPYSIVASFKDKFTGKYRKSIREFMPR